MPRTRPRRFRELLPIRWVRLALALGAAALGGSAFAGCTPELGDKCILSTDCSLRGDRTCDTSQPGGYCTIRDCRANSCPDDGTCVMFEPTVPGCAYDSRSPSRVGRSYCMASCEENGDCRDGYVCADPKAPPWSGVILDDDVGKRVCIIPASAAASAEGPSPASPVCSPIAPDAGSIDATVAYDAAPPEDAASDADPSDADPDAPDGAVDGSVDGGADADPDADPSDAAEGG